MTICRTRSTSLKSSVSNFVKSMYKFRGSRSLWGNKFQIKVVSKAAVSPLNVYKVVIGPVVTPAFFH